MTATVSLALVSLCVADGALVGYRAVCGRSAFVDRRGLDRRGLRMGAAGGLGAVAVLGAWFAALLATSDDAAGLLSHLTDAGLRMLDVYAVLAVVVAVGVAVISVAPPRWGSLAMVTVLGPLTLLRPVVLAAGAAAAVVRAGEHRGQIGASSLVVLLAVGIESVLLDRWGSRAAAAFVPGSYRTTSFSRYPTT